MTSVTQTISEDLRRRLVTGEFQIGARFPRIIDLAHDYPTVSTNTIRRALAPLVQAGYLEVRQGAGTWVRALPRATHEATARSALTEARDALAIATAAVDAALAALDAK
jgi:DNA-binding GntR family transcriptional regulator